MSPRLNAAALYSPRETSATSSPSLHLAQNPSQRVSYVPSSLRPSSLVAPTRHIVFIYSNLADIGPSDPVQASAPLLALQPASKPCLLAPATKRAQHMDFEDRPSKRLNKSRSCEYDVVARYLRVQREQDTLVDCMKSLEVQGAQKPPAHPPQDSPQPLVQPPQNPPQAPLQQPPQQPALPSRQAQQPTQQPTQLKKASQVIDDSDSDDDNDISAIFKKKTAARAKAKRDAEASQRQEMLVDEAPPIKPELPPRAFGKRRFRLDIMARHPPGVPLPKPKLEDPEAPEDLKDVKGLKDLKELDYTQFRTLVVSDRKASKAARMTIWNPHRRISKMGLERRIGETAASARKWCVILGTRDKSFTSLTAFKHYEDSYHGQDRTIKAAQVIEDAFPKEFNVDVQSSLFLESLD